MCASEVEPIGSVAQEGFVPVENCALYYREVGRGAPGEGSRRSVVVLHGGPDFDHRYLLPDMDRLSDSFRLVYYDQRGRGRSGDGVRPEDVSMASEVADLEGLRRYFGLESMALLGHSWGAVLALAYAIRHPERVSHLILMNTAPACYEDFTRFRQQRGEAWARDVEELKAISATAEYQAGELEADAAYYRVHFRATVRQPEHLEEVVGRLRLNFTEEGILKARAIEARLMGESFLSREYDLLPQLSRLRVPTLVIHGDYDFIPVECAANVAQAIPGARFVVLSGCGHFSFMECPDEVGKEIGALFGEHFP